METFHFLKFQSQAGCIGLKLNRAASCWPYHTQSTTIYQYYIYGSGCLSKSLSSPQLDQDRILKESVELWLHACTCSLSCTSTIPELCRKLCRLRYYSCTFCNVFYCMLLPDHLRGSARILMAYLDLGWHAGTSLHYCTIQQSHHNLRMLSCLSCNPGNEYLHTPRPCQ
jgi:hypothetical protein